LLKAASGSANAAQPSAPEAAFQEGTDGRLPTSNTKERNMHGNVLRRYMAQRRAAVTGLLVAAGLALAPAFATADETQTRKVRVADLDLASPAGKLALDRRLRFAIEQVCSPRGSVRARAGMSKQARSCRQEAMADVQRQLEAHGVSPALSAGR
jgi:UrcA family protein